MKASSLFFSLFGSVALLAASAPNPAHAEEKQSVGDAWDAFHELQAGNKRFVSQQTRYKVDAEQRAALAGGQQPHTIVLSCSDSRVPPELLFDQGLGQLFVIRVAGQVLDDNAVASIEYAVEHLHAKLILVLGHERCGAVKAALAIPAGQSAGSPALDTLVHNIQCNLGGNRLYTVEDKSLAAPVKANVSAVALDLLRRSHILQEGLEREELLLAQGIYALGTGEVSYWYVGQPPVPKAHKVSHAPVQKRKAVKTKSAHAKKVVKHSARSEFLKIPPAHH